MVFTQALVNGLVQGSIFALFAAGFTIIFGVMDIPNMGHAALFAGGAYIFYQVVEVVGLPWYVGLLAAILIIAIVAAVIEQQLIAPLYDRDETDYIFGVILVTVGIGWILERAYAQTWGHSPLYLGLGGLQDLSVDFADMRINYLQIVVFVVAILSFAFLYVLTYKTMAGRSLRAIVQDRELAQIRGVNVDRIFLMAFMLGSGMAAFAGILNAAMFTLTPVMGFELLIKAFIIVILGGVGRIWGAAIAGYALGIYEAFAVLYLTSYYIFASEFALLIVFFLAKGLLVPEGSDSLSKVFKNRVSDIVGGI
jgi:branched-chain amino acid transport system permease protein